MMNQQESRQLRRRIADALQAILLESQYREDGVENVASEVIVHVMTYAADYSMHLAAGMEFQRKDWVSMIHELSKDHWTPNGDPLHPTIRDMEDKS